MTPVEFFSVVQHVGFPIFAAVWLLLETRQLRKRLDETLAENEKRAVAREQDLLERIRELEEFRNTDYKRLLESYHSILQDTCHVLKETEKTHERLLQALQNFEHSRYRDRGD